MKQYCLFIVSFFFQENEFFTHNIIIAFAKIDETLSIINHLLFIRVTSIEFIFLF